MRVFVTGATGFVGSAVTRELIAAGHAVLGLARSEDKAGALAAAGAEVLIGTVQDEELLARAIEGSDGVIHTAFNHDFSTFVDNCRDDMRVIAALARGL
ncbi:MAG: NAD(P)H-binding protein, partial [Rhodobacteraceae bacterium]|nr:NAD(P)H-binding protein [Paracoccaceae bacterium]